MSETHTHEAAGVLHVFNVGQGDSILIEFAKGKIMVIDCYYDPRIDAIPPVLRYLDERGIHNIDILCLTHPDRDHYKGMVQLIDWVWKKGGEIRNLILFGGPTFKELKLLIENRLQVLGKDSGLEPRKRRLLQKLKRSDRELAELVNRFRRIASEVHAKRRVYRRGGSFSSILTLGNAEIYMLGPASATTERLYESAWETAIDIMLLEEDYRCDSMNDISCILWVFLEDVSILLPGDASEVAFREAIEVYEENYRQEFSREIASHILKVSHHGSKYCSSRELWDKVARPEGTYAVISAGVHEKYNHPHEETLQHILQCGSTVDVYCTNICPSRFGSLRMETFMSLREALSFDDDSRSLEDAKDLYLADYRCHGDCRFDISYSGKIVPVPQIDQGRCWYLNKGQKDQDKLCFEGYRAKLA